MAALTPEKLGAPQTEHAQQVAIFAWAALRGSEWPELRWLYAVPNGGDRDRVVAGRMKAEGTRRGVPDMALPVAKGRYHGLYVELKLDGRQSEHDGGMSVEQVDFAQFATEQGYAVICAYGWQHATRVIAGYLGLGAFHHDPTPIAPFTPNNPQTEAQRAKKRKR